MPELFSKTNFLIRNIDAVEWKEFQNRLNGSSIVNVFRNFISQVSKDEIKIEKQNFWSSKVKFKVVPPSPDPEKKRKKS